MPRDDYINMNKNRSSGETETDFDNVELVNIPVEITTATEITENVVEKYALHLLKNCPPNDKLLRAITDIWDKKQKYKGDISNNVISSAQYVEDMKEDEDWFGDGKDLNGEDLKEAEEVIYESVVGDNDE